MKPITFRPTKGSRAAIELLMSEEGLNQSQAINAALCRAIVSKVTPINLGEPRPNPLPSGQAPKFVPRVDPDKIDAFQRQMVRKK